MISSRKILCLLLGALILSGCSRQQSDWEKTRAANATEAYELFLKKYPNGEFSAQAQARVKELYEERDWQKSRDTDTAEAYQAFLKQYPEGKFTEEARIRVENFNLAASPPPGGVNEVATSPDAGTAAAEKPPVAMAMKPAAAMAMKPAPAMAMALKPAPAGGAFGIQLGAFKSSADAANARWADLSKQYPQVLSGLTPKVSSSAGASGTIYRLQVHNMSEPQARSICKSLSASRQACVVVPPGRG